VGKIIVRGHERVWSWDQSLLQFHGDELVSSRGRDERTDRCTRMCYPVNPFYHLRKVKPAVHNDGSREKHPTDGVVASGTCISACARPA
jgi:hypothetical protein